MPHTTHHLHQLDARLTRQLPWWLVLAAIGALLLFVATDARAQTETSRYFEQLRQQGYTIAVSRQTMTRTLGNRIAVGLGVVNISDSKVIKYMQAEWRLYNRVGDPVPVDSSIRRTKYVGPIEPGEGDYKRFSAVWKHEHGSCVVLRRLVVEHIDGSSFTYVSDLADITRRADGARLRGECSYQAQKERG